MKTFHHRRLPHYHNLNQPIFLTWRLYGSLPDGRAFLAATTSGEAFVAMDRLLDNATVGPLWLRMPDIAKIVEDALHYRERTMEHFDLHSYVIMPNHVHILITPRVPVSKLMQSLKRFSALEANRALGSQGPFWQDESYDRLVRDATEFNRIADYVEMNPVKAGLVPTPEEFLWSSARRVDNPPQVGNLPHMAG